MKHYTDNATDRELRVLHDELYLLRRAIVHLMPSEIREVLDSYHLCETREDTYRWADKIADELIEMIQPSDRQSTYGGDVRADCPLCGQGSQGPYVEGYKLPEGMRRHLVGYGNTQRCDVMHAATALARDYWNREFAEICVAEAADLQRRRDSETLYKLGPRSAPRLLDEGIFAFRGPRTKDSMEWVKRRLEELEFTSDVNGNVRAYTRKVGDFVVYADPREEGRIYFSVYAASETSKRESRKQIYSMNPSFYILDQWKHDLPEKFLARASRAIAQLETTRRR